MEPPATLRFAVSSVYHSPHEEGAVIQFSIGLHTLHAVRPPAVRWVRRYLSILRGITFADRTRSGFLSAVIASLGFAVLVFRSRPFAAAFTGGSVDGFPSVPDGDPPVCASPEEPTLGASVGCRARFVVPIARGCRFNRGTRPDAPPGQSSLARASARCFNIPLSHSR